MRWCSPSLDGWVMLAGWPGGVVPPGDGRSGSSQRFGCLCGPGGAVCRAAVKWGGPGGQDWVHKNLLESRIAV